MRTVDNGIQNPDNKEAMNTASHTDQLTKTTTRRAFLQRASAVADGAPLSPEQFTVASNQVRFQARAGSTYLVERNH